MYYVHIMSNFKKVNKLMVDRPVYWYHRTIE